MMYKRLFFSIFFVLVSVGIYYFICDTRILTVRDSKFHVVCTTNILADTVRHIVKDSAKVTSLMGPGIDPHLYRAREGDVHRLAQADLVLYHGLYLEGKMAEMLSAMDRYTPSVAVSECIPKTLLRESDCKEIYDPHIWHDVSLWMRVVAYVEDILCQHDIQHVECYRDNTLAYMQKLQELDNFVRKSISMLSFEKRILVTAHDAFSYFGAAYDMEVVALQGMSTEADIGTKDIRDLADFITKYKIQALFLESSVSQRALKAVKEAVEARGWRIKLGDVLYSDALGDKKTNADTYIRMIRHNVSAIVQSLATTPTTLATSFK